MSIKAYQSVQDRVTDPRRIEIMVFQKCNALLTAAARARAGEESEATPLAAVKCEAEALFENERLWTSLLADLAVEENQLPAPLRAQLISLGIWACRYIDKIRYRKASFAPLIDVNAQMIAGLTTSLEASHSPSAATAAPALGPTEPMFT